MNQSIKLPMGQKPFQTLTEISTLLALSIRPDGESQRITTDKVRKRLRYAVENGSLHFIGNGELQLFFAAEVFAWARQRWPEAFGDIRVRHEANTSDAMKIRDSASARVLPGNLENCHELLRNTYSEIDLLKEELVWAEKEIARLRPLAERYEENRQKNRRAAKRPRKNV